MQYEAGTIEMADGNDLRTSEQHYRLLVDSVRDYAIFMLDPAGRVATWNAGAQRIKGYTAAEVVGKHFSIFYPEADVKAGKCEMELDVATREGRFEDENWRVRKDGSLFWANVVITALFENAKLVGFAKVTRDLTERRLAEEERIKRAADQRAREVADAANRSKDDFIAHVSHELRTPLNAILGWSRILLGGRMEEARAHRATQTIERNALAMAQLIDDLLDVSRIVSGKMRLEVQSVDLALVIERAIETVKLAADAKHITIRSALDGSAFVPGDPNRLQQVVWNLLSNAVKFTPRDGHVDVVLERHEASVDILVRDDGIGIPPDMIGHVFAPFWQGDAPPVAATKGLGLGLAICKNLVELHGGHIDAQSDGPNAGTTFVVRLPVAPTRQKSDRVSEPRVRARLPELEDLRVLVVEDEPDARELLRTLLEAEGAIVETAGDVEEALRLLDESPPDVLLSDIGLPGESGFDLIHRIRSRPPEKGGRVPAAAITAYSRPEDRIRALSAGFLVHVGKPIDPNELRLIVAALANQRIR